LLPVFGADLTALVRAIRRPSEVCPLPSLDCLICDCLISGLDCLICAIDCLICALTVLNQVVVEESEDAARFWEHSATLRWLNLVMALIKFDMGPN